jgi:hypothetical protein
MSIKSEWRDKEREGGSAQRRTPGRKVAGKTPEMMNRRL